MYYTILYSINKFFYDVKKWFSQCAGVIYNKKKDDGYYVIDNENDYYLFYDEIWDL